MMFGHLLRMLARYFVFGLSVLSSTSLLLSCGDARRVLDAPDANQHPRARRPR